MRYTIAVDNRMPTSANLLGRSPDHRWTGVTPDMSTKKWHAFGADALVHLRTEQRKHGDKMSARSKGNDGTLKYFGPDELNCRGSSSKGAIIYDMDKNRISIERNFRINRNLHVPCRGTRYISSTTPNPPPSFTFPASGGVDTGGVDSDGDLDMSSDEKCQDEAAEDHWRTLYATEAPNETYRSVARRFAVDLTALLDHNMRDDAAPRPMDRMMKNTGVWLPDDCLLTALHPDKPDSTPDRSLDLGGRIFRRGVKGYGDHYGVVVEGRDGKGRYKVVYDDLDGIETARYLRRSEFVDGLLPKGTGSIHVTDAVQAYDRKLRQIEEEKEAADTAYAAHAAYVAKEIIRGALPSTDHTAAFSALIGGEHDTTYWRTADGLFDKIVLPRLTEVNDLAAGLACHTRASPQKCVKSWPNNQRCAEKIYHAAIDNWCAELLRSLPSRPDQSETANLVEGLEQMRQSDMPNPKSFAQAMKGKFAKYWKEAIAAEIANLKKHGTFQWVPPPSHRRVHLDGTWAFKAKAHSNGMISRLKARLVARGFKQIYGHDYTKSMAPVGKLVTFRWLLAEMAHRGHTMTVMDIESAYLQATLKIPQLMKAPKGSHRPRKGG